MEVVATQPKLTVKQMGPNLDLVCHSYSTGDNLDDWKIAIPYSMLFDKLVERYHLVLTNVRMTRLKETLGHHFHQPKLDERIRVLVRKCNPCQRYKSEGKLTPNLRHATPRQRHGTKFISTSSLVLIVSVCRLRSHTISMRPDIVGIVLVEGEISQNGRLKY
jgi:hypothetical protein